MIYDVNSPLFRSFLSQKGGASDKRIELDPDVERMTTEMEARYGPGSPIKLLGNGSPTSSPERPIGEDLHKDLVPIGAGIGVTDDLGERSDSASQAPAAPAKQRWAEILANNQGSGTTKLSYHPPTMSSGIAVVKLQSSDFVAERKACEELIIGYFVGKRLAFGYVKGVLSRTWKLKNGFDMKTHTENTFIFKFNTPEDREQVLDIGSLHIASRLFILRPWRPFLEDDVFALNTTPIWICLKNVPLLFWNPKGIEAIASAVGAPLKLDKATEDKTRMNFAKVCVEVNINSTFPSEIHVVVDDDRTCIVGVDYTWKPVRCKHCKVFGHSTEKCPKADAKRPAFKFYRPVNNKTQHAATEEGWEVPKKKHMATNRRPSSSNVPSHMNAETSKTGEHVNEPCTDNAIQDMGANTDSDQLSTNSLPQPVLDTEVPPVVMQAKGAAAEVEAEPGLSTPISTSEEKQVVEVLRAIAGKRGLGADPTTLMDCLIPQAVKGLHSAIAKIGKDALVAEIHTSLEEEAAKH